ncbi:ornithine cyclodeaminase family protein [Sphingomonas asaccharolytica]|uniref:ornithine cyclodeaminase family protein n=1 Tax=Sphingomonas asaccharolytica TaxID=40681 RepID=UPI00157C5153|nr:ornithine cyclodeaminase family protein [Sphingomonas asaccharolytica]
MDDPTAGPEKGAGDATVPVIGAVETRDALPFDALIPALKAAFIAGATVPERHHHHIPHPEGDGVLLLMPAWSGSLLGTKIATIHPGNSARGLPSVHSTYLLADAATGAPLALLDGNEITTRRTIAVSALAASFLAREHASDLLIVGAGRIAALAAEAFAAVRPIRTVSVWNRDAAKAERLVAELRATGFAAEAATSLEDAARRAGIVTCATPSTAPIIHGDWLQPGTHLDLIGSFTPAMREADDACFARGQIYVDTRDALAEAGDLTGPIAAGVITVDDIRGSLADLCTGRVAGRASGDDITVFKSVGTALADLAAAAMAYARRGVSDLG